ncbi:hypothetical protein BH10BDE1_BH10BDE1_23440 [soil metagenome]
MIEFKRLTRLNSTQLLEEMLHRANKLAIAWQRLTLEPELLKLIREAKKPLAIQDRAEIKRIWKSIQPDLRTYGILHGLDEEPMKSRLLAFLKGNPVTKKDPEGPNGP